MASVVALNPLYSKTGDSSVKTLTDRMKERTTDVHKTAETTPFMQNLLQGEINKKSYCQYLTDLSVVFGELEAKLGSPDKLLESLNIPLLFRKDLIANDLEVLDEGVLEVGTAAQQYVEHIRRIGSDKPHLLIAHSYVQYLAIMFGGQMMKRMVAEKWEEAVQFYDFSQLLEENQFRSTFEYARSYKDVLNRVSLTAPQMDEIVQEAQVAFEFSVQMLQELE